MPANAGKERIRVLVERQDGVRAEVASGSSTGQAILPQPVLPGERVVIMAVDNEQELMFARIHVPLECALRTDQGGGTTSTGPG